MVDDQDCNGHCHWRSDRAPACYDDGHGAPLPQPHLQAQRPSFAFPSNQVIACRSSRRLCHARTHTRTHTHQRPHTHIHHKGALQQLLLLQCHLNKKEQSIIEQRRGDDGQWAGSREIQSLPFVLCMLPAPCPWQFPWACPFVCWLFSFCSDETQTPAPNTDR